MKDDRLWKWFSIWTRLRDADSNGICTCITSGRKAHWKEMDAGHFISRRHNATKYDEQNVNAQSRHDNRFAAGKQFEYAIAIDKKYGKGTAEKLLNKSKMYAKALTKYEIDHYCMIYKAKAQELSKQKNLPI